MGQTEDDLTTLRQKSIDLYKRVDFVGAPSELDKEVTVGWDHLEAIFKTRRLSILASLKSRGIDEQMVVTYGDALFATCSVLVGPEFRLLPYDNNKKVHISDWWAELKAEMEMDVMNQQ